MVGTREWPEAKHHTKAKRKLHPRLDLLSGGIICAGLTMDKIGDPTALPDRLNQIDYPVACFPSAKEGTEVQLEAPLRGAARI